MITLTLLLLAGICIALAVGLLSVSGILLKIVLSIFLVFFVTMFMIASGLIWFIPFIAMIWLFICIIEFIIKKKGK